MEYLETVIPQDESKPFLAEINNKVLPNLKGPDTFFFRFAAADGVPFEADADDVAVGAGKFGEKTNDGHQSFLNELSEEPAKIFAEILYALWSGETDEEIKLLADQEMQGPLTPWLKYLAPDKTPDDPTHLQELWSELAASVLQ